MVRFLENLDESSAVIPEFVMNVIDVFEDMATPQDPTNSWEDLYKDMYFYDDVSGQILNLSKAIASRRLEMDFFKRRWHASAAGFKVVATKWMDVNKGS